MRNPLDPDQPVTVLVTEGRWDVVDSPTPRNIMLTRVLTAMGGINESVAPGTYYFNVKDVDGKWTATLYPA